ncbi:bifunctional 3-(3-hydroxy-phenyl)propionate/3-hydroxycinnamic acid hydroxylase [Streptomyces avicenniae]|uniref:bifunctional 3-(3-hydroxy-phenyl)propionate/3-hydroxycinnamic acid hydroxylase MhpA n=1 Tax=Streptomyces avicenniae TaxID=500153 RepID=UPI00069CB142|nr:bifunctional 3-(3-hydroxy-phenyl)propionate/3-hydroxycinnamic acid hydroxylase [Streptomyces avicenniae]
MTAPGREPVAVIGAGPVGLTAALLLARHGVACDVFERHATPWALPRAVHLDDEVVRVLQAAGAHEEFLALSRPALGMQLIDGRHRVLARFPRDSPLGDHGFPQANMFDQPDLERLLRAHLARQPGVRLHAPVEVTGLTLPPPGSGLPVRVRLRDGGGERTFAASAVLGCDGAASLTREAVGARNRDLGGAQRWLVVDVRCARPLPAWDGVHQICDPAAPGTYMRIGPDRYRWEFRLGAGAADAALADPARLSALLAPWTGSVPAREIEVLRTAAYTFHARVADRWRRGRVFLLGDAAHLTPPFIGQGLGAGLRDARNLTWKLARVLDGAAPEQLLDTYEAERRPHATRLVRTAVLVGHAMTNGHPATALARTAALRVGRRSGALSRLALANLSPPLTDGTLTAHRPAVGRGARPGDLCPQPYVLTQDGSRVLLDEVLGDGFSLLTCRPPAPRLLALARTLPARVVSLSPGATAAGPVVAEPDGRLAAWLGGGAVLLRPDRVVLAAERGREAIAASAAGWAALTTADAGTDAGGRPPGSGGS